MQRRNNKVIIDKFCNHYCDALACALGEFIDIRDSYEDILKLLSLEEAETLIDYAVLKNKMAGVERLNIKVPLPSLGVKALEKYDLKGSEIISAKNYASLPTSALIGDNTMLDIENLLDYNQELFSSISDFCARADMPICISIGSNLEEVGRLVNGYNMSPVEVLESFGFLDRKCFVYGLNFIDKDDQKLLKDYCIMSVFSPQDDALCGRGAINLYNFIYNDLKFGFSSGKCYNIDMLFEGKLARLNTNNLMHEGGLVTNEALLDALCEPREAKLEIELLDAQKLEVLFDKKVYLKDDGYLDLLSKVTKIATKIKEKI